MGPTAVVGDDIQQVAHAVLIQPAAQFGQGLIPAKMRVDVLVIHYIVFMVGKGGEDRVQVEGIDAQVSQVIQMLGDARQIAAVKNDTGVLILRRGAAPGQGLRTLTAVLIIFRARVVGGVAIGKAVREDLVKNALLHPGRRVVTGQDLKIGLIQRLKGGGAGRGVPPDAIRRLQQEAVMGGRHADRQVDCPQLQVSRGFDCVIARKACSPSGKMRSRARWMGAAASTRRRNCTLSPRAG